VRIAIACAVLAPLAWGSFGSPALATKQADDAVRLATVMIAETGDLLAMIKMCDPGNKESERIGNDTTKAVLAVMGSDGGVLIAEMMEWATADLPAADCDGYEAGVADSIETITAIGQDLLKRAESRNLTLAQGAAHNATQEPNR
jgi:hypothetical protein